MDNTDKVVRNSLSGKFTKKNEDDLPTSVLLAGALATDEEAATETPKSGMSSLMQELLLDELAERRKKRKQEEDDLKRLLEARTVAFKEETENKKRTQAACNHRKEDMRPNIGGQRLSNGHTAYICGNCFKVWEDNLPANLQIKFEHVGG